MVHLFSRSVGRHEAGDGPRQTPLPCYRRSAAAGCLLWIPRPAVVPSRLGYSTRLRRTGMERPMTLPKVCNLDGLSLSIDQVAEAARDPDSHCVQIDPGASARVVAGGKAG